MITLYEFLMPVVVTNEIWAHYFTQKLKEHQCNSISTFVSNTKGNQVYVSAGKSKTTFSGIWRLFCTGSIAKMILGHSHPERSCGWHRIMFMSHIRHPPPWPSFCAIHMASPDGICFKITFAMLLTSLYSYRTMDHKYTIFRRST